MRPVPLIVYGSFTCPYSYLASAWVDHLAARGEAVVEWRAVCHDPSAPEGGRWVEGDLAAELDRELTEVRSMLGPGGPVPIRRPQRLPNPAAAVAAFADYWGADADRVRRVLFAAVWEEARDVGDARQLRRLGADEDRGDPVRAAAWGARWRALPEPVVPAVVLPTGAARLGRDGLAWLAALDRTWSHWRAAVPGEDPDTRSDTPHRAAS